MNNEVFEYYPGFFNDLIDCSLSPDKNGILFDILCRIPESILVIDSTTRICFVNDSYLKMFNIPRERILGHHLRKFEPLARINEVLETGEALTGDISHIYSAKMDVSADIVPLKKDGVTIGALAPIKDITSRSVYKSPESLQEHQ